MRLIDVDAVWDRYNKEYRQQDIYDGAQDKDWLERCINEAPTVDAEPVRHGKWLSFTDDGRQYEACSECEYTKIVGGANSWCPACGARMEVEGD